MTFRPEIDWMHVTVILIMIACGKTNRFVRANSVRLPGELFNLLPADHEEGKTFGAMIRTVYDRSLSMSGSKIHL